MTPADLILRCYGYERKDGSWYAVCVDLNVDAEGRSVDDVKRSLNQAIYGYLETVAEIEDQPSLVQLLRRKAPLKDLAKYHFIRLAHWFRRCIVFEEAVPVHPAVHCGA